MPQERLKKRQNKQTKKTKKEKNKEKKKRKCKGKRIIGSKAMNVVVSVNI